jgi:signal transduction histidine kinase
MADIVVAAILGFLSDRDRKAQERLREVESLAAMGRVMSEVAHDIKTPLLAMSGLTRIVERTLGKDNPSREKLTLVIRETERLERLMQDMMAFSRPMKLDRTTGHIDQVVKECLELVESKARERSITLHGQSAKNLQPVSFDGLRMKQLLINLLTNAVEASPKGETVTVQSYQKRKTMFLDIIDHGCGVPQDKREKIFSPFFTTKQEGTGLGLSIVKKIVEAHHGHLEILDNPEKGVTFRVAIPTM